MKFTDRLFHLSCLPLGIGLLLSLGGLPASALPGQTVEQVVQWSAKHPVLPKLQRGVSELSGQPYYASQAKLPNGVVNFLVSVAGNNQNQVAQEKLAYGTRRKLSDTIFTPTNAEGVSLLQRIYNPAIARDFRQAKYLNRVQYNSYEVRFYQGQRFGYITTQFKDGAIDGQRFYHWTITSLSDLKQELAQEQRCRQSNPNGCGD